MRGGGFVRTSSLLPLLLLASCGDGPQAKSPKQASRPAPLPQGAPAGQPGFGKAVASQIEQTPDREAKAASSEAQGAAAVLQSYYALIEARRYGEAWELRERGPNAPDAAAFARNFERYREHRATVGAPSEPVAASGFLFVEVPVHTYGVMKDGRGFGSAGTVTLRRSQAGSKRGQWRIYTSG